VSTRHPLLILAGWWLAAALITILWVLLRLVQAGLPGLP
jgi:hypothetical protein